MMTAMIVASRSPHGERGLKFFAWLALQLQQVAAPRMGSVD